LSSRRTRDRGGDQHAERDRREAGEQGTEGDEGDHALAELEGCETSDSGRDDASRRARVRLSYSSESSNA